MIDSIFILLVAYVFVGAVTGMMWDLVCDVGFRRNLSPRAVTLLGVGFPITLPALFLTVIFMGVLWLVDVVLHNEW